MKSILALPLWFGFACLVGCSTNGDQAERTFGGSYPIRAVATTGMVADLVRHVGGSSVRVDQLMGADVDPHLYKASQGDVSRLNAAHIIFYSGLHLEGKMISVFESIGRKKPTIAVADGLTKLLEDEEEKTHDPHVWFDVSMWSQAAGVVRDGLVKFDPKNAAEHKARADVYQAELAKLHDYARAQIATIPREQRVMVTAHDAFRYFGRAYDIEVKGIQGMSTESQASLKDINDLVKFLVDRKIKAVFVETSVNPKNITALIEGCQSRGHKVAIGGELFSDAMGKEGTPEGTYVGMVRHNVDTIVRALK